MSNTTEKTESQPILPIDPTFLSLSSKYHNINLQDNSEELKRSYNPNIHGLFDVNTIRGFLAVMSSDLDMHSQLPLFQIVPLKFEIPESNKNVTICCNEFDDCYKMIKNQNEQLIRIDVGEIFPGNPCCTVFKKKYGKEMCTKYDSRVLLLFCDRISSYDYKAIPNYKDKLDAICKRYNEEQKSDVEVRSVIVNEDGLNCDKFYITYICGFSNYREYAFPIFHNNHVIAAIMMGQRTQNKVCAIPVSKYPEFNVKDDFEEFDDDKIKLIFNRIHELELKINNKVRECAQDSISIRFIDIEEQFRNKLSNVYTKEASVEKNTVDDVRNESRTIDESVVEYKTILNDTLKDICSAINSKGLIWLYAKKLKIYQSNNSYQIFNLIGKCTGFDSIDTPMEELRFPYGYDFEKDEGDEARKSKAIAAKSTPIINWNGIGDKLHKENDFLDDFSILIREYFSESFTEKYREQYTFFRNHLQSFYHTLFEPYNILRAAKLNKNLEISMRITVHEAGNILPTIQQTLYSELKLNIHESEYLNNPQFIPDTRTRSLWDLYQRTLLLHDIYKRSTIAFKDVVPEKSFHDFHRLIYSIRTLFDEKAEKDGFQKITIGMSQPYHHVNLYTDSNLFHQILFNLVDNAVKYGYMGSNMTILVTPFLGTDASIERLSSITISVISFGNQITEEVSKHIFDLFYRDPNSDESGVDGMGIGLFLVKKMCEAMDYRIDVTSEFVADHHITAHYFYMKHHSRYDDRIDENTRLLLDSEISRLQLEAVNQCLDWSVGFHEMSSLIKKKTYKNTFAVTLNKNNNDRLLMLK